MRISFFGACREVTGSNILVETCGKKILLDCGFFQGYRLAEERNYSSFPYDPKSIDAVVICHAHLDHTGRLPKLVKDGFRGRIYSTAPTCDLTRMVLEDSEKLMSEEAAEDKHEALYDQKDIDGAMELFESISYEETVEVYDGIKLTLKNSGHILGSAIAILAAQDKKLVYTSDLGNSTSELLSNPQTVDEADVVICETTYGGRIHEDISRRHEMLNQIISSTISQNGVLMIPTFAIERTQELLHDIEHFCTVSDCAIPTFYLDSPLAIKVTSVFEKYPQYLNPKIVKSHHGRDYFGIERVKMTTTVEESKEINDAPCPKIIIAGSGMLNGGRILYHLKRYIDDPKNTLLIVGYQAVGTLGRRFLEGEKQIKIFGEEFDVKARVVAIGSYSAHADSEQLLDWLGKISRVEQIFLVHGESDQALSFGRMAREKLNTEVFIPQQGEEYEI